MHQALESRFWAKVEKTSTCWLWIGAKYRYGYGKIFVCGRLVAAHRASWELHYGAIPEGLFVLHNCPDSDNPACVRPEHLFLGTQAENMADKVAKGRHPRGAGHYLNVHPEKRRRGEAHHAAKLSRVAVSAIRVRCAAGEQQKVLAGEYGVSRALVCLIVRGKIWQPENT